ncbi:MAG: hypothetical protein K5770_01835 [Lachnospiraceae bacterium]|nr:hypothetical protein [Lachnospiraceae bacterium]
MKKEDHCLKLLLGAVIMSALPVLICGCGIPVTYPGGSGNPGGGASGGAYSDPGPVIQDGISADVPNPDVPDLVSEGELIGLYYEKGGSMQARSDFMIEVNPEEIVKARYWPSDGNASEIAVIEHVPISEESWQDVVKIVNELRQFMVVNSARYDKLRKKADKENVPAGGGNESHPDQYVMDDRPYTYLDLTLSARGTEDTIPYTPPQDRRFLTFENILMELVDPAGREIVWYEGPELVGIYFTNDLKGYSYQCTLNSDDGYKFYAYSNFLKNHFTSPVTDAVWERVKALCDSNGIMDYVADDRDYKIGGTLYMSDGRQKVFEVDKKTAETLRLEFEEIKEEIESGELK